MKGHVREIVALAFAPDGKTLASRSADEVKVWNVAERSLWKSLPSDGSDFGSIAFSPDGKTLGANRAGEGVVAWDLGSGREPKVFREASAPFGLAGKVVAYGWGLSFSPDGKTLAGGGSHLGEDGFVSLWDVETGEARRGATYISPVTTVAYAPDGKTLAVGSMSGSVDLFDPGGVRDKLAIPAARGYLAPVAFSPDGRILATASDDRTVKLWETDTGRDRGALKSHMKGVLGVAFHPGGRVLASGDAGGTIFLWDIRSRLPIARLMGHRGKVWAVAFGPDPALMASAGEDRDVRIWDVSAVVKDLRP